ncbi:MAG: hypothetical protein ACYDGX_03940 [Thermoleophilia bacterium]
MESQIIEPESDTQPQSEPTKHRLIKPLLIVLMSLVILVGVGVGLYLWQNQKIINGNSFIFPGATLVAVDKRGNDTAVSYETYSGGVQNYYKNILKKFGWVQTGKLGAEDITLCGGDWGGIYEKGGVKFKLHICGPDDGGSLKNISFLFYNADPSVVLGNDFSGGAINCVTDGEVEVTNACSTKDNLKITVRTKNPKVDEFQVEIDAEGYVDGRDNVKAISNNVGGMEMNIGYDLNKYTTIKKVVVEPIISNGTICSVQRKEADVKPCQ